WRFAAELDELLTRYDVLATPTVAECAPRVERSQRQGGEVWYRIDSRVWAPYTWQANLTHQPAAPLFCGTVEGLPAGIQLMARRFEDRQRVSICSAFQRVMLTPTPSLCTSSVDTTYT